MSSAAAATATGWPKKRALIVDTDMGFDDVLALHLLTKAAAVSSSGTSSVVPLVELKLISTVSGINAASFGAECARGLFPSVNVAAGADSDRDSRRADCHHSWLPAYRERFNAFASNRIGTPAKRATDDRNNMCAMSALVNILSKSNDDGCDLLCLGPLTNVARWLDDPVCSDLMTRKLGSVWILGGNHPDYESAGSPPAAEEFNFATDPRATRDVLESPHLSGKLRVVTAEVSGSQSPEFSDGLEETILGSVESSNDGRDGLISHILRLEPRAIFYDPVCAYAYVHSRHISDLQFGRIKVRVAPETGRDTSNGYPSLDDEREHFARNGVDLRGNARVRASAGSVTETDLPMMIRYALQNLKATGHIEGQLDPGVCRMIKQIPEHSALQALEKFSSCDVSVMRNKAAYLAGILKRKAEESK